MPHAHAFDPARPRTAAPVEPYVQYLVIRNGNDWYIEFKNKKFGPYKNEREALLFAVEAAHKLGQYGRVTQVSVLGANGVPQVEWTYGVDMFPRVMTADSDRRAAARRARKPRRVQRH